MVSIGNTQKLILTSIERQKEHKTTETKSKEFTQAQKILIGLGIALGTAALSYAFFSRNQSVTNSQTNSVSLTTWDNAKNKLINSVSSESVQTVTNLATTITEAENTKEQLANHLQILVQQYVEQVRQAIRLEKLLGNDAAPVIQGHCTDPIYSEACGTQQDATIDADQTQLEQTYSTVLAITKLADPILSAFKELKGHAEQFMNKEIGIHYPGYGYYPSTETLFSSYEKYREVLENPDLTDSQKSSAFYELWEDQKANSPHYTTFVTYLQNQCVMMKHKDLGHGNIETIVAPCSSNTQETTALQLQECSSLPTDLQSTCTKALPLAHQYVGQVKEALNALNTLGDKYRSERFELIRQEKVLGNSDAGILKACTNYMAIPKTCETQEGSAKEKTEAAKNIENRYEQMKNLGQLCYLALTPVQRLAGIAIKQEPYFLEGMNPRFEKQLPNTGS